MKKLKLKRIVLQESNGTLRRICSFDNPVDKFGEFYLKLAFPDLHERPLYKTLHDGRWETKSIEIAPDGMYEFSYHYKTGVAHLKTGRLPILIRIGSCQAHKPPLHFTS